MAKLAKLNLTDEEIEKYTKQLEETVEYVENLNELNTGNVKPTSHTVNLENVYFQDGEKNKRGFTEEQALKNTKKKKNNFFVVKRIL